jgi:hypothetical protein
MNTSRRGFLKQGLAATGALAVVPARIARAAESRRAPPGTRPRALRVSGVHVYADRESFAPHQTIRFHISTDTPVRATVCRLGLNVDDPAGDEALADFGTLPVHVQPIHPGSLVHVEKRILNEPAQFAIEAWVRPWRMDRLTGIVSQENLGSVEGWGLAFGGSGEVGFFLGDGMSPDQALDHRSTAGALVRGKWHHLVASWDGARKQIWVDGRKTGEWPFTGPLRPGRHPIRLGALATGGAASDSLDGDLAMVVLYRRAPDQTAIRQRFNERGLKRASGRDVLACWSFEEEQGDRVADRSAHRRHGRIINHATWMIGGPAFEGTVPRFEDYNPSEDPNRGHGLRLASDDLYDCEWEPSLEWQVPPSARSGFHVLRLSWEKDGQRFYQHATFVVRRPRRERPAPILLLAATNTWRAYNAAAFGMPAPGARQICGTDGLPNAPEGPPAFSFYRGHAAGQGTYQIGSRMPWPAAHPYLRYGDATDYSHLARADRFAQTWLEREGYEYELISDLDLHQDPGQLSRHRVFIINGHSEYWSIEMYRGLEEYLAAGGRVIVLSGNSLFWRVSFNRDGTIMECRKVDAPGNQLRPEERGEAWHSHDRRRGGMLRECGYHGWKLIGLETLGWNNHGNPKNYGPWIAEATDDPLFHTPHETGLKPGDRFGWAGEGRLPMANGHEFDVRPSTLAAMTAGPIPPGASMPDDPPGIRRLANGIIPWRHGGAAFDYFFRPIRPVNEQGGEMIWWERPDGGTVFNAGSIGAGWALAADPRWAALLRNVLHRFGVSRP